MENNSNIRPVEEQAQPGEFEAVKTRLEEIARLVDDENLPLDDALDLYEEAVKLGLQASNLLETGIVVEDDPESEDAAAPDAAPENAETPNAVAENAEAPDAVAN